MNEFLLFAVLSVMPATDAVQSLPAPPAPVTIVQPLAALRIPPPAVIVPTPEQVPETAPVNCRVGHLVMIPDGREGEATSYVEGICRVLAYGEGYVSLWTDDMIEAVYPQLLQSYQFGH